MIKFLRSVGEIVSENTHLLLESFKVIDGVLVGHSIVEDDYSEGEMCITIITAEATTIGTDVYPLNDELSAGFLSLFIEPATYTIHENVLYKNNIPHKDDNIILLMSKTNCTTITI
jgi:hypothetical protein